MFGHTVFEIMLAETCRSQYFAPLLGCSNDDVDDGVIYRYMFMVLA